MISPEMITDTEIRRKGVKALAESLGEVEAERFIALIQREPFDYTEWQSELYTGESVRGLSAKAMGYQATVQNKTQNQKSDRAGGSES